MKKLICVLLLVVTLAMMFSACALKCDKCGKILPGKTYKTYDPNSVTRVEIEFCEDCYKEMGFNQF